MSSYVFPPPPQAAVAVAGSAGRYAVRRIFCVGRNYAAHAREMGSDPEREPPFYFTKSAAALVADGSRVPYAPGTHNLHYEMELVAAIGAPAFRADAKAAQACVWGYACGLDMTRRDLQAQARDIGRPWDLGKDFENSAVMGVLVPAAEIGHPQQGRIGLRVNGALRQEADIADMIWQVPDIVANLSQYYHLQPGDLIYTGTPEGVGPVQPGDRLEGWIDGVGTIALDIGAAE